MTSFAPWRDQTAIVSTIVTVEDITAQLEQERDLVKQVTNSDDAVSQVDMVPLLIECAIDPDVDLRIYAIQALGAFDPHRLDFSGSALHPNSTPVQDHSRTIIRTGVSETFRMLQQSTVSLWCIFC